jgi:hypothetical protein
MVRPLLLAVVLIGTGLATRVSSYQETTPADALASLPASLPDDRRDRTTIRVVR